MTTTASLEGAKKAVFFVFKGKNLAVKWLIGSAIQLANYIIPIIPAIPLYGYVGQIAKRIIRQEEDPELPDWNDFGLFFSDGIKFFGVSLLYMLPGVLLMIAGYFAMSALNFAFLLDPGFYTSPSPELGSQYATLVMLGVAVGMVLLFLGMILMVVAGLFLPPALGHTVAKGEFGAAFRVREWWPVFKANFSGYILAMIVLYGVYMVMLGLVYALYFSVILCCLMPFALCAASFGMSAIQFSLIGIAYRDGLKKLAEKPA
jgi:hypothetical protein